jgi:hypothetical protein
VAVSLLFAPGLALALALRLRGWTAVGGAPLLSMALLLVAMVVAITLGLRWTPLTAGCTAAVVLAVVAGGAAWQARRHPVQPADHGARPPDRLWSALAAVGALTGAGLGALTVHRGTGGFREPNQGFDALFHVNLVELIARSGDVSPGVSGTLNGYPAGTSVYPDAFHALASLVAQLHGGSLVGINALMACVPAVAGVGLVALLRSMDLVRPAAVAPVVLAATTGYPTDPTWHGPIWVFVFGIAFVPAFLVLLRHALAHRTVPAVVVLGLAAAALAMVHPSAALAAALFAFFLVLSRWVSRPGLLRGDLLLLAPAAVLAAVVVVPLIGKAIVDSGGGTVVDWPVAQTPGEALGELATYNYETTYPQLWLAVPALLGLAVGWRYRALRWWYGGTVLFAVLCVAAASYEGRLVQVLTGPWWNDRFRFAALVFLALAVFCAVGLVHLADLLAAGVRAVLARRGGHRSPRPSAVAVVSLLVVVLLLGVLSKGFYTGRNEERLRIAYVPQGGGTVAPNDRAAFAVLKELTGDRPVLNDPNDGSAWMWPLAGIRPVFGAALTTPVTPPLPRDRQLLIDRLNCLDSDQEVRDAIAGLGVRYVYSSATTIVGPPTENLGFLDLSEVRSLRLVYELEGAAVYEIDPVPLDRSGDRSGDGGPCLGG